MLAGKRKKDYATESAANALETQANELGMSPIGSAEADDDDESDPDDLDEATSEVSEQELVAA